MVLLSARVAGPTGYAHSGYVESLCEFGLPLQLPGSGGWVIQREIPGHGCHDAMGCYPMFACQDWSQLVSDLDEIGTEWVSLALVLDPFGEHNPQLRAACFPDVCKPFKEHFVIDLERAPSTYVSDHHRRNAQKGLENVTVQLCEPPLRFLDDWTRLYGLLIRRHTISGIPVFSNEAFRRQMATPGLVALCASYDRATVGLCLWYVQGPVAHYHLGAFDETGYALRASFALFWRAIDYFAHLGLRWLNLGAGAGVKNSGMDGLRRFKRGLARAQVQRIVPELKTFAPAGDSK